MSSSKGEAYDLSVHGYVLMNKVGEGAYGEVFSAKDRRTDKLVAVKRMVSALDRISSCRRTVRELKFLRLAKHENIVPLLDIILPGDVYAEDSESKDDEDDSDSKNHSNQVEKKRPNTDLYAVFELMETDLTTIIKSSQTLSNQHCMFFIYQVLRGLKFVHTAGIIHRDLKPRNLLVNANCDLKICDFGLARLDTEANSHHGACMTDYIATRWYRPPEVVVASGKYTKAIDMWAVGCILAELILRKPIFPAADQYDLLHRICRVLGPVPESLVTTSRNPKMHAFLRDLSDQNRKPTYPLARIFKNANPDAIDLLSNLLVFDPEKRFTVQQALAHPYLANLHLPSDEPSRTLIADPDFYFEENKDKVHLDEMRYLIRREADLYPTGVAEAIVTRNLLTQNRKKQDENELNEQLERLSYSDTFTKKKHRPSQASPVPLNRDSRTSIPHVDQI